jgi:hypothetical protein
MFSKLNLLPWLLLALVALLASIFWNQLSTVRANLATTEDTLASIQEDMALSDQKIKELAVGAEALRKEGLSLKGKLKQLENSDASIKEYLATPVPPDVGRLLNEARTGKAAK